MYTLRCTRRLLRRLPLEVTAVAARPSTLLGDWYANVLFLGRSQHVLCTNERSLLSVIVPLKDPVLLPFRLQEGAQSLLLRLGFPSSVVAKEARAMSQVTIGTTVNRSVLGSMNEIAKECRWLARAHGIANPATLELKLTDMPMLSMEHAFTREQAAVLLGAT